MTGSDDGAPRPADAADPGAGANGGTDRDPEADAVGRVGYDPDARAVDRADYDPDYDPTDPVFCEVCGGEMYYTASCKLKCPRCGYMRDCSDP